MSNIDWDNAPTWAKFYAEGQFYKVIDNIPYFYCAGEFRKSSYSMNDWLSHPTYQARPAEWPSDNRIDAIGHNGATGEHYKLVGANEMVEAKDFLNGGLRILGDRGKEYGSDERECSFSQVAQAFNAITGKELKGSDVCLILALVKQVRQYAHPERFHEDSAVDGVNYTALQAQELKKERK